MSGEEVIVMTDSNKCPCVTCPQSRDCTDDFFCRRFEDWFASLPSEAWAPEGGVRPTGE